MALNGVGGPVAVQQSRPAGHPKGVLLVRIQPVPDPGSLDHHPAKEEGLVPAGMVNKPKPDLTQGPPVASRRGFGVGEESATGCIPVVDRSGELEPVDGTLLYGSQECGSPGDCLHEVHAPLPAEAVTGSIQNGLRRGEVAEGPGLCAKTGDSDSVAVGLALGVPPGAVRDSKGLLEIAGDLFRAPHHWKRHHVDPALLEGMIHQLQPAGIIEEGGHLLEVGSEGDGVHQEAPGRVQGSPRDVCRSHLPVGNLGCGGHPIRQLQDDATAFPQCTCPLRRGRYEEAQGPVVWVQGVRRALSPGQGRRGAELVVGQ